MTTLSKEGLVKVFNTYCKRNGIRANGQYAVEDCMPLFEAGYNAARADLVAENERLKSIPMKYRRMAFNAELQDETDKLRTALAAAEADNERLRDAAAVTEQAITKAHYGCVNVAARELCDEARPFAKISMASLDVALKATSEALAQPRDDSALREMIAGVYEECAKVCEDDAKGWTDYSCEMAARDCADAIRALAEKAKGG